MPVKRGYIEMRVNRSTVPKGNRIHESFGSRLFDVINIILLLLLAFSTLYPFWDTLVVSVSSLKSYLGTSIHLWPSEFSFEGYSFVFGNKELWTSYANTIFVTVVGTAINMIITIMTAYVLSKTELRGHRIITFLAVFTMMFSGGIIPTYMIVKATGLTNSLWSMILPSAINTSSLIILRNFFMDIPKSLEEAAMLDGCTEVGVLFRVVIPNAKASITTIALMYAVDHWNDFYNAVLYISDRRKWPLQLFLRSMLFESDAAYSSGGTSLFLLGQPMKMAAVMLSIIPIICMYPFFQKHFSKGVMVGAVKG